MLFFFNRLLFLFKFVSIHQLPHHLLTFEGQTALPIVRRLHLRFNREIKQENNRALLRF